MATSGMMTASTATALRSPSAEPVVMRALARTPFCQILLARTTKLYDRTDDEITLDEVERITI
jgi:hypothetical protein